MDEFKPENMLAEVTINFHFFTHSWIYKSKFEVMKFKIV